MVTAVCKLNVSTTLPPSAQQCYGSLNFKQF